MKEVKVILSEDAKEVFEKLNVESNTDKQAKSILKAIKDKAELIKQNIHYGQPISKKLIPKEYVKKYDITNLFRVELPSYWRMLYTLTDNDQIEIVAFVLDIVDHKKYDKKFGYN
jgi:hypothetical protein